MDAKNTLLDAFKARALEEAKPLMTATENAHSLLAEFSTTIQAHAEYKALADILAFLKQPAPPVTVDMATKARELRTSLLALADIVAPWASPEAIVVPAPTPPPVVAPPLPPPPKPVPVVETAPIPLPWKPTPTPKPVVKAPVVKAETEAEVVIPPPPPPPVWSQDELKKLLSRLEDEFPQVDAIPCVHPERTLVQIKAMVSETRHILASTPTSDPLHRQATNLLRRLGGVLTTAKIDGFVYGLALNHYRADWMAEGAQWRQQLTSGVVDDVAAESAEDAPPAWPHLRQAEGPILLVGNLASDDRLVTIKKRYNLDCEWAMGTNPGSPIDAVVQKLQGHKVRGVVLLDGFLPHNVVDKVTRACTSTRTPWTYGGRGGVATLRRSFAELDRMLSPG